MSELALRFNVTNENGVRRHLARVEECDGALTHAVSRGVCPRGEAPDLGLRPAD